MIDISDLQMNAKIHLILQIIIICCFISLSIISFTKRNYLKRGYVWLTMIVAYYGFAILQIYGIINSKGDVSWQSWTWYLLCFLFIRNEWLLMHKIEKIKDIKTPTPPQS